MVRSVFLVLVLWVALFDGAAAQSPVPGAGDLLGPRRGSGAAPELPSVEPAPPPQPGIVAPSTAAPAPKLSEAPIFVLRGVKIEGNSVLDDAAIREIVAPHIDKPASIASLEELRRALTLLYIQRGYINSGVTIPDQNVESGVLTLRAVEGRVTEIDVSGTDNFAPEFFRSRLERGLTAPFKVSELEQQQQILLQDPLVRRLNLELLPGLVPGEAKLHADVQEASPFSVTAQIANNQSPSVGEIRGQIQGSVANILGVGDILAAQYGRSQGINDGSIAYSLPIASDDTRVSLRYDINGTVVVTPALAPLNVTSRYDNIAIGISRPMYRTAEQNFTLGANLERRRAQTFLLGEPFSFTAGSSDGKTNVTALRLYQDWLDRDAEHAFAARSTLSFGLHAFGATVTQVSPTGKFFSWLGQAQYVRRVYQNWEAVIRSNLQLANRALFPIEQYALGGVDSVRGYRQYLTLTDDAFFASGELRIPIANIRVPYLADSEEAGRLQLVPFYDFGRGWNIGRPTPYPPDISGAGLGLRWNVGSGLLAEVYYARPLRHVRVGTALLDRGIYFRLTTKLY
jgi:hemolysin activation/secretion protein